MIGEGIAPNTMTIAEWSAYMDADAHDRSGRSEPAVSAYTSRAHRALIAAENKVAAKFASVEDGAMFANVRAWVVAGAKDSDRPASCD